MIGNEIRRLEKLATDGGPCVPPFLCRFIFAEAWPLAKACSLIELPSRACFVSYVHPPCNACAVSELNARQEPFQALFPMTQCIAEKRAEVGLDDLELAGRHRDRSEKIIDNVRTGFNDRWSGIENW